MTHSYVWYDSFTCVTWLIHMWDMTDSYAWHDLFMCVTWLIYLFDMTHSYTWHDLFISVTWLIHTCDMTHSYVWHDSFIYITWLIHICDMTHSYMWHDSFISVTWLIHICDMGSIHPTCDSNVWHNSFTNEGCWKRLWVEQAVADGQWLSRQMQHVRASVRELSHVPCVNESCHTYEWVMSHIWMSHVTHMNESCHTYEWVMSHIWMSHVPCVNESCHTYEWVSPRGSHVLHSYVGHNSSICGTWLIHMWDVTQMEGALEEAVADGRRLKNKLSAAAEEVEWAREQVGGWMGWWVGGWCMCVCERVGGWV